MLSYIFVFMVGFSVVSAIAFGKTDELSNSILSGASESVELIIMMSGMMCLWSGVMEVAKESKLTEIIAKALSPILKKLFPDVKKDSDAFYSISMNVSANLLGLGNAATPLGLKAMKELKAQGEGDVATDSMITFVVLNTASIQLLPTTIGVMRGALGSRNPFDIIFCVLVTSAIALIAGLSVSKILCKRGRKLGTCDATDNSVRAFVRTFKKSERFRGFYKGRKRGNSNAL